MSDRGQKLVSFIADEQPAIAELRAFVGGQVGEKLDGTPESLPLLDAFLENLTAEPTWFESVQFEGVDIALWLAVRVAYYFGWALRRAGASNWYLSDNISSSTYGTPVVALGGLEISPLEIAHEALLHTLHGGLAGVFADWQTATSPNLN
jgi:hypothetical protein